MKDFPQEKYLSNRNRFSVFAYPYNKHERGWESSRQFMQTRDEVEGLYNCLEFPQPVECLYQAVQTQEKIFFCFYKIFFLEKEKNTLFYMALIKREILTSLEVLYTKLVRESVLVLPKRCFSKYGVFSLKMSA